LMMTERGFGACALYRHVGVGFEPGLEENV
jgi:hypothetical protein